MPTAHLSLREEDVVKLALEFLQNRELNITQLSLERETGVINGGYSDDALFLRQLILDGQWEDVLEFIQPLETLENFDSKSFKYLILRYKYIELLCIKSEANPTPNMDSAVEEVVKVLNELEKYCPSKEEYSKLCLLLTLPRLVDHTEYKDWNPSGARVQCFKTVYPIVEKYLPTDNKKVSQEPQAKNDRMMQLVIKGLLYESCVEYCQQKATSSSQDQKEMRFSQLLNGTGFSDSDLSLLSWLQSIPPDTFACPFEQRTLNVDIERLEKPSLEASWTEHMLVTPIKPKTFPHSAMPYTRPKAADIMSRSLNPALESLPIGLSQTRSVIGMPTADIINMSKSFASFHLTGKKCMNTSVDRLFEEADVFTGSSQGELPTIMEKTTTPRPPPRRARSRSPDKNRGKSTDELQKRPLPPTPDESDSAHLSSGKISNASSESGESPQLLPRNGIGNGGASAMIRPVGGGNTNGVAPTHPNTNGVGDLNSGSGELLREYQRQKQQRQEVHFQVPQQPAQRFEEYADNNQRMMQPQPSTSNAYGIPRELTVPASMNPSLPPKGQSIPYQPQTPTNEEPSKRMAMAVSPPMSSAAQPPLMHQPPVFSQVGEMPPNNHSDPHGLQQGYYDAVKSGVVPPTTSKPHFIPVTSLEDVQAVRCAEFHPFGKLYAVGSNSKTLRICSYPKLSDLREDHTTYQPTVLFKRTKHHKGSIYCLAWSPVGDLIATGSNDKTVKLMRFNAETCNIEGQEVELTMHDGTVRDLCFIEDMSNKSSLLISGGAGDCKIYVTDCATGTPFQALSGHSGHILSLYTWGGAMFVSGAQDRTVRFWDLRTRGCVNLVTPQTVSGNKGSAVAAVCVDPSGRLMVTGHEDSTCVLYDIRGTRPVQAFKPHTSDLRSVRFSPSAYYLLSAGYDGRIVLTDLQGDLTMALPSVVVAEHKDKVISGRWHPNEFSFVSTSADKTCSLWALPPI